MTSKVLWIDSNIFGTVFNNGSAEDMSFIFDMYDHVMITDDVFDELTNEGTPDRIANKFGDFLDEGLSKGKIFEVPYSVPDGFIDGLDGTVVITKANGTRPDAAEIAFREIAENIENPDHPFSDQINDVFSDRFGTNVDIKFDILSQDFKDLARYRDPSSGPPGADIRSIELGFNSDVLGQYNIDGIYKTGFPTLLNKAYFDGTISAQQYKSIRDSIGDIGRVGFRLNDGTVEPLEQQFLDDEIVDSLEANQSFKTRLAAALEQSADVGGAIISAVTGVSFEVLRKLSGPIEFLDLYLTVHEVAAALRDDDQETAHEILTGYALSALTGAGGFVGGTALAAAAGKSPIVAVLSGLGFGAAFGIAGDYIGRSAYQQFQETFDTFFNPITSNALSDALIQGITLEEVLIANISQGIDSLVSQITGDSDDGILVSGDAERLEGGDSDDALLSVGPSYDPGGQPTNEEDPNSFLSSSEAFSRLDGGAGNDVLGIYGNFGQLFGGEGDDLLVASHVVSVANNTKNTELFGGDGADTILVEGDGAVIADSGAGADSLFGGTGDDSFYGGAGDDDLYGEAGNDLVDGGFGDDLIYGGKGDDRLEGGAGDDVVYGEEGADSIIGDGGFDPDRPFIQADTLYGGDGNDTIDGGDQNDLIYGDADNDVLKGGTGADLIYGGDGKDTLETGSQGTGQVGVDRLFGGEGDDVLKGNNGGAESALYGGAGDDTLEGRSNDSLFGDAGADLFITASGAVVYAEQSDVGVFGFGGTLFVGGSELTELTEQEDGTYRSDATGGTAITLIDGRAIFGAGDDAFFVDSISSFGVTTTPFQLTSVPDANGDPAGGSGKTFQGDNINPDGEGPNNPPVPTADNISGTGGRDNIFGYELNDVLNGLGGNDNINGGNGDDQLTGGAGSDNLSGGNGSDNLSGGSGSDNLNGGSGNNTLSGGSGQDLLTGGNNNDSMDGGSGFDTLRGNAGQDTLIGGAGRDGLYGGSGNDLLSGGADEDYLDGGFGNDTMNGGTGRDTVIADSNGDQADGGSGLDFLTTSGVSQVDLTSTFVNFERVTSSGSNVMVDGGSLGTSFVISLNATGNGEVNVGGGHDKITLTATNVATIDAGGGHNGIRVNSATSYSINTGDGYDEINVTTTSNGSITDTGGSNQISVGAGNANIVTSDGDDTISAGAGSTSITDSGGDNQINVGAGNSTISTAIGSDTISLGAGDHVITDMGAEGEANRITVGEGASSITSADADDTINLGAAIGDGHVVRSGSGDDSVTSASASDGDLDLDLGLGDDVLNAFNTAGNVSVLGGEGSDDLNLSGTGVFFVDLVGVETDANHVTISKGGSTSEGGSGTVVGGLGSDTIDVTGDTFFIDIGIGESVDYVDATANEVTISALGGNNEINVTADSADILSGVGDDRIEYLSSASTVSGTATIDGGDGNDTIESFYGDFIIDAGGADNASDIISVWSSADVLSNATISSGSGIDYILVNGADFIINSGLDDFADTVIAAQSNSADIITGGGDDYIRIDGQPSDPGTGSSTFTVNAGTGADTILDQNFDASGATGTIIGGDGADLVSVVGGTFDIDVVGTDQSSDTVSVFSGSGVIRTGDGGDDIRADGGSFEIFAGSDFGSDFINVTADDATINGGDGDDSVSIDGQRFIIDVADTTFGADTITGSAEVSANIVTGTGGDYISLSNSGSLDINVAGSGFDDDTVIAEADFATITGGAGNDSVQFNGGNAIIDVTDGVANGGDDTINVFNAGAVTILGGEGEDSVISSFDTGLIDVSGTSDDAAVDFVNASGSTFSIFTGDGADTIRATVSDSVAAYGGEGADIITAFQETDATGATIYIDAIGVIDDAASDSVSVGGTEVIVLTGDGADTINVVHAEASTLYGGAGDDVITANIDELTFIYAGLGADTVTGTVGDALIDMSDSDQAASTMAGGSPDLADRVTVSIIDGSAATIIGGDGGDTVDARGDNVTAFVDVTASTDSIAADDDWVLIEAQFGDISSGAGNDTISHQSGDFYIDASVQSDDVDDLLLADNDIISASGGAGTIIGGHGDDYVQVGQADGDVFVDASTTITGAFDNDTVLVSGSATSAIVHVNAGDDEVSAFVSSVEIYATGAGSNNLFWNGEQALVFGGDGADTIRGVNFETALIYGHAGDDFLEVGPEQSNSSVEFYGGTGSDTIGISSTPFSLTSAYIDLGGLTDQTNSAVNIAALSSTIVGTNGDNQITVNGVPSSILTGDGSDVVFVGNPNIESDVDLNFELGDGDNQVTIINPGSGLVSVGSGDDHIVIDYDGTGTPAVLDLFVGAGSDTILVDGDQYEIYGLEGDDFIRMEAVNVGQSTLFGGAGDDTIYAGNAGGGNLIDGGDGDDLIYGSDGGDTLRGGLGADTIIGLAGDEAIGGTLDEIDGDFVKNFGSQASLTVEGLFGLTADDLSIEYVGDNTNIIFDTPSGTKTITLDFGLVLGATPVEVAGVGTTFDLVAAAGGSGSFTETIIGTGDADQLTNTFDSLQWVIYGLDGADTLAGADRDDELLGGGGADLLYGFDGDDELSGGTGADTLFGGDGNDFFVGTYAELDGDYIEDIEIDGGVVIEQIGVAGVFDLDLTGITTSFDGTYTTLSLSSASGSADIFIRGEFAVQQPIVAPGEGTVIQLGTDPGSVLLGTAGSDVLTATSNDDWLIYGDLGDDSLFGAGGRDLIYGEDGDDFLYGANGADTLDGGSGDDALIGGAGADSIQLGTGEDVFVAFNLSELAGDTVEGVGSDDTLFLVDLFGLGANDVTAVQVNDRTDVTITAGGASATFALVGSYLVDQLVEDSSDPEFSGTFISFVEDTGPGGADTIEGTAGDDVIDVPAGGATFIDAGPGADTVTTTDGDNEIRGQAGDDVLSGAGGADSINGGEGNDIAYGNQDADTLLGWFGADTVYGGEGNDSLLAQGDDDLVIGGIGDDTGRGGDGNDIVYGNIGNDDVRGENGNDTVYGGDGFDTVSGNAGRDFLFGDGGDDTLRGGDDADTIYGGNGADEVRGENGDDLLYGGADADTLRGASGADTLFGEDGDDLVLAGTDANLVYGGDGEDDLRGQAGGDTLYGGNDNDRVDGENDDDTIYGDAGEDTLEGGNGNDLLFGGADNDTLYAENDDDTASGGAGNDNILGQSGNDVLYGNDGVDTLRGDSGADTMFGGAGNDIFYSGTEADVAYGGADDDDLRGGAGNDTLNGGDDNDKLRGEADADALFGDAGNDQLFGGDGNDVANGGDGNDTIWAEGDNDILYGGADNDRLFGQDGDDTISGDGGNDTMQGGAGADLFVFDFSGGLTGSDIIQDFSLTEDKIQVVGVDAQTLVANTADVGGNATITHAGGTIRLQGIDVADVDIGLFM